MKIKVGINGLGRIGRTYFRHYLENPSKNFEVTAIKDVAPIQEVAYLIKHDSTYGLLNLDVKVQEEKELIIIGGKKYKFFRHGSAHDVPWSEEGIKLLIGSTDHDLRNESEARRLVENNNFKIIFTTSRNWCESNLIYKFNHQSYDPKKHSLISSGTCTGNAIIPVADVLQEKFGIKEGSLVTIHCALTDQRVVDCYNSKNPVLGRSAKDSIMIIPTRIGHSLADAFPHLKGKLNAVSFRVPTTIVSMINATFTLDKRTSVKEVNEAIRSASESKYSGVIKYEDLSDSFGIQKASIDFIKENHSSIFLPGQTELANANHLNVSIIHDNEWGYIRRLNDIVEHVVSKGL